MQQDINIEFHWLQVWRVREGPWEIALALQKLVCTLRSRQNHLSIIGFWRKVGNILSIFEMNRLRIMIWLVSYCTFLLEVGLRMSRMAWIIFGFTSTPHLVIGNSRNFLAITPKVYLVGFCFIWWQQRVPKLSSRSEMWLAVSELLTSMSLT